MFTKRNNPPGFYVYLYLREDGTPYYAGKGIGKRAWAHSKKEIQPPADKSRIIFPAWDLLEIGAFTLERKFVCWFGRKDLGTGILRNKTDGGDGASGYVFTEEDRKKQKEGQKKTQAIRLSSLKKYHATVDKTSNEYLDRIEKIRAYQKKKVWTKKALQNLKDIAVKSAANRKGGKWSEQHRQSRMQTYLSTNLEIATKIIKLADQGFNKLTIAKTLNVTWDKVKYSLLHRAEFEAYLKENQNY
jgi:hypothetical protein